LHNATQKARQRKGLNRIWSAPVRDNTDLCSINIIKEKT